MADRYGSPQIQISTKLSLKGKLWKSKINDSITHGYVVSVL